MRFSSFPLLTSALLLLALCQTRVAWSRVDTLRTFPEKRYLTGAKGFEEYLRHTFRYPVQAQQAARMGTSLVSFILTPTGKLASVAVVNPLGKGIDEEVVQVLQQTKKLWLPVDKTESQDSIMLFMSTKFLLGDIQFYVEPVKPDFILNETVVVGYNPQITYNLHDDAYYVSELSTAFQKKNHKRMLNMVDELIRRNPYSDKLYLQRAKIEQELGQTAEACSDYKKIIYFLGKKHLPKQFIQNCP